MPKILPNVPAVPAAGADALFVTSQLRSAAQSRDKSDAPSGGFEKALDGARRRERPKAERDDQPADTDKAVKPKAARPKHRTERRPKDGDAKAAEGAKQHDDESTGPLESREDAAPDQAERPSQDPKASAKDARPKRVESDDAAAHVNVDASQVAVPQTKVAESAEQSTASAETAEVADAEEVVDVPKTNQAKQVDAADSNDAALAAAAAQTIDADENPPEQAQEVSSKTPSSAANPVAQTAKRARPVAKSEFTSDADAPPQFGGAVAAKSDKTVAASANRAGIIESLDPNTDASGSVKASPHQLDAAPAPDPASSFAHALEALSPQDAKAPTTTTVASSQTPPPPPAPEVKFADDNHPAIVAGVRGQLMPDGGTMHLRLDPPELGPLAVTVRMRNGVMEASFETSNDEAAKLLSHSLSSLKSSLESQGMNVERLHVQQAPKSEQSNPNGNSNDRDGQQGQNRGNAADHPAQREQQRREMLRRMWRKLSGVEDPLDLVA
jgi:flagellar hook-length control protein FliK